jgi:soluble lytic murein transglycosylase-like protein
MRRSNRVALLLLAPLALSDHAVAQAAAGVAARSDWRALATSSLQDLDAIIAQAAHRFGVPQAWIRAVIQAESAFDPHAVSSAGALGLMQLMPATYAELRARHGLGVDPFSPRDNIFAGAAYLRDLYDRFGEPGVLAAYNAGPNRYAEYLRDGRPLPSETLAYERRVRCVLARSRPAGDETDAVNQPAPVMTPPPDPLASPLFVVRDRGGSERPSAKADPSFPPEGRSGPRHRGEGR